MRKSATPLTPHLSSEDEGKIVKILGLVRHPEKGIKGWWYDTPLYDEDFEKVVGHQYKNATEYIEQILSLMVDEYNKGYSDGYLNAHNTASISRL